MTNAEIIEVIKGLTVLELNDLVKALIDKFNQKFPLFKAKVKPEFYGPCHLDISTCTKI